MKAHTSLFIASAFLTQRKLEALEPSLKDALQRGVKVDLLWGYSADGESGDGALKWLGELAADSRKQGLRGQLRFNSSPSNSHAKFLIFDTDFGYEATIGSYNWLSASTARTGKDYDEISVRVEASPVVAALCRCASALWANAATERLSATVDNWRRVAADLESQGATAETESDESFNAEAGIILDRHHDHALRRDLADARSRLLVASHRLGPIAANRLIAATGQQNATFAWSACYGETNLPEDELADLDRIVASGNGSLRRLDGMHSKIFLADDRVIVGSYNFLSADPFGTASRQREVSLDISGVPADWIWDVFTA